MKISPISTKQKRSYIFAELPVLEEPKPNDLPACFYMAVAVGAYAGQPFITFGTLHLRRYLAERLQLDLDYSVCAAIKTMLSFRSAGGVA
jgi:hypothetical protein